MPIPIEILHALQAYPHQIRNVCVIAHVDHGKTTLTDSLVSSNGMIGAKSAGKMRFMDYTAEEQARGITMKSSSVALLYKRQEQQPDDKTAPKVAPASSSSPHFLINLVDSPGHVDFIGEVIAALHTLDGAIVVVDVVEGVCIQTQVVLRQAWRAGLIPCLVLNKIDRLYDELSMSPEEAYEHLRKVLQQVNACMASLLVELAAERSSAASSNQAVPSSSAADDYLEEAGDDYFVPGRNVLFASAIDGWAFRLQDFAALYAAKLGLSASVLLKTLWGEFYLQPKTRKIVCKQSEGAKSPVFVQFVLKTIWDVYTTLLTVGDERRALKMAATLGTRLSERDLAPGRDRRDALRSLMSEWLPLSRALFEVLLSELPSPVAAQQRRAPSLLDADQCKSMERSQVELFEEAIAQCSAKSDVKLAFVSKVLAVPDDAFPRSMAGALTSDENNNFVAFARCFSGTLNVGDVIYALGPRYNPMLAVAEDEEQEEEEEEEEELLSENGEDDTDNENDSVDADEGGAATGDVAAAAASPPRHSFKVEVSQLFTFMGRQLEPVSSVSAGSVFGLLLPRNSVAARVILKTALLTSTLPAPQFSLRRETRRDRRLARPVLRVAIEPERHSDLAALRHGLRQLNRADPAVELRVQRSGELVLACAGELHLQRCLSDLQKRFARGIDLHVSDPLVPYSETVTVGDQDELSAGLDCDADSSTHLSALADEEQAAHANDGRSVEYWTSDRQIRLRVRARRVPDAISVLLESGEESLAGVAPSLQRFVVAVGPPQARSNLLVVAPRARETLKWPDSPLDSDHDKRAEASGSSTLLAHAVIAGFRLATVAGPICEEPLHNVCFIVEEMEIVGQQGNTLIGNKEPGEGGASSSSSSSSGQLTSIARVAFRQAMLMAAPRLVESISRCELQVTAEFLGKAYAVLGRRRAKIVNEEMKEGTDVFSIDALMPLRASFGLTAELNESTSGAASVQLVYHGWAVLEADPFYEPEGEDLEEHGVNTGGMPPNLAKEYVREIRIRKGLKTDEQVVIHAEKQRTLMK